MTSRRASPSPGISLRPGSPPQLPLIGRATELGVLQAALTAADAGRGRTIFLTGESGIGKSRLVSALGDIASQRGFTVAVGRAYPMETGVPYAVFADALLPIPRQLEPSVLTLLTRGGSAELLQLFPALDTSARAASPAGGDPAE